LFIAGTDFWQETASPGVTNPIDQISEVPMSSLLMQPSTASRVSFYEGGLERSADLAFIRHQLDALAYARAVCGLRPKDEIEYERLCEQERAMLEAVHRLVVR
jgi:hypothetical protein